MIGDEPTNTDPLQKLRAALHDKAKSAANFRFYALYDKVYRRDAINPVAASVMDRIHPRRSNVAIEEPCQRSPSLRGSKHRVLSNAA